MIGAASTSTALALAAAAAWSVFRPEHVGFPLPLNDEFRPRLALRVDDVEGADGSAGFVISVTAQSIPSKPRVDIGERMRPHRSASAAN